VDTLGTSGYSSTVVPFFVGDVGCFDRDPRGVPTAIDAATSIARPPNQKE
jgi:hypothetical protein